MDTEIASSRRRYTLDEFCNRLEHSLIKNRCQLLHLIRMMLEDKEQALVKIPLRELRHYLLNLHEVLSAAVDPATDHLMDSDVVGLKSLQEQLNKDALKKILSAALSHVSTFQAATQSLITLGTSLAGSGILGGLALSPFAPMPQEVRNLTSMSGTTASSCKETVDAPSSSLSKEEERISAEAFSQLSQLDIGDISDQSLPKNLKRKRPEASKIYSGK